MSGLPVSLVALWWAAALVLLALGAWMAFRPDGMLAWQRRMLERQLAMLDGGGMRLFVRFSGGLVLACALLMVLILALGGTPLAGRYQ